VKDTVKRTLFSQRDRLRAGAIRVVSRREPHKSQYLIQAAAAARGTGAAADLIEMKPRVFVEYWLAALRLDVGHGR
jgi:hypothetical protein